MTAQEAVVSHPRLRFVERVGGVFEEAGVKYAILHDSTAGHGGDSDLDIAVGRESLETVDWIIRAGMFGRLLQRLDYDVPWCRYYVVESDEPGRRYRQIDIACDPWGIGRYGESIRLALADAERSGGRRVASPAAETLYLALKRARKGRLRPGDAEQLRSVFERDPAAARALLEQHLGKPGAALADALRRNRPDLTTELDALRRQTSRARWTPAVVWRRLPFETLRLGRRVLRPTGFVVAVVGPDGVGKSTLAQGLESASAGAFRHARRLHFRPGLLPQPARLLGRASPDGSQPRRRPPSGRVGSLARIGYLWLDARIGWWPKVSSPRIRSTLVVLERGWADMIVDPRRYRVSPGTTGLTSRLGRLLPHPDLVLFLDADSRVVYERKPELDPAEIDRQLRRWRELMRADAGRSEPLDATETAEDVLDEAVARINDRLASRQFDVTASELAWAALGNPAQRGMDYWVIARRGRPRWFLQARAGSPGLIRTGIYRPATARQLAAAATLDAIRGTSRGRLGTKARLTVDPETGLAPAIASHLGRRRVSIAAAAGPKDRGGRAILSVCDDAGRLVAFAKVAGEAEPLQHERQVLEELARIGPTTFVVPRVLALFESSGAAAVLVLEPLQVSGRSDRPLAEPEVEALAELSDLGNDLERVLGRVPGQIPAHGDFAPWNSGRTKTGRLALWDWEDAHLGDPLEDFFHWQFQRLVLLSSGNVADLVGRVLDPDPVLLALCAKVALAPEETPSLLRSYVERTAADQHPATAASRVRVRAIELLDRARA